MIIIPRTEVDIASSNIPADTHHVWDSSTTYNAGDTVQYNNSLYTATVGNSGVIPSDDPITWEYAGPTNETAMFDAYASTASVSGEDIELTFTVSDVDALTIHGLTASFVEVELSDTNGNVIFTQHIDLVLYNIADWWEWTYAPPTLRRSAYVTLPMLYEGVLRVKIGTYAGTASCAHLAYGRSVYLGATLYGATTSVRSNVNKTRAANGHVYLSKGVTWQRITLPVTISNKYIDIAQQHLAGVVDTPTIFVGDEREGGYESLLVFGFYRDFDIAITATRSKYTIEVEGIG